ncbi:MAG: hypothetical protein I8H75_05470 [Myxococcaceae bacterium]|nr:hypothetical protein [Myxococcaceae bacterium]MBH2006765.1 hypothetical protein [Myxococcaceae bacterium]
MFRFFTLRMCLFLVTLDQSFALSAFENQIPPYGWVRLERAVSAAIPAKINYGIWTSCNEWDSKLLSQT